MKKNSKAHIIAARKRPQPHKDKWWSSDIITDGKGNI